MREIPQPASNSGEGSAWAEEFRRALAREDLALTTVHAFGGEIQGDNPARNTLP